MKVGRAVVTGGAGFLGSHLCQRLLVEGWEVIALDNFLTGGPGNVAHLLGSPASPIDYLQLPIDTMRVGSIGTLHTLGLAKEKGARFLLASTSEAYGDPLVHPQPDTVLVRIFNTFGPRMRLNDGRASPTFVRQALNGETITVAGDGSQTRSICYVEDMVDGIQRVAELRSQRADQHREPARDLGAGPGHLDPGPDRLAVGDRLHPAPRRTTPRSASRTSP